MEGDCLMGMSGSFGGDEMFGIRQGWWLHNTKYTKYNQTVHLKKSDFYAT